MVDEVGGVDAGAERAKDSTGQDIPARRATQVGAEEAGSLPYASSLCGACYDVRPVTIDSSQVCWSTFAAG